MEIVDSALLECSVGGAKLGGGGGAVFVDSKAQLVVMRSEFRRNSVEGGLFSAGALSGSSSARTRPFTTR
jgi:hypothetical protein